MKVRFNFNKDNHYQGEVIDIKPSDFKFWYWSKKGAISPIEDKPQSKPKQQRKRRSKEQ